MQFTKMIVDEQNRRDRPLSINALMILSTIRNERRITVERLSEVIHLNKIRTNDTIESLVEAELIEAIGNGAHRSYILGVKFISKITKVQNMLCGRPHWGACFLVKILRIFFAKICYQFLLNSQKC